MLQDYKTFKHANEVPREAEIQYPKQYYKNTWYIEYEVIGPP